METTSESQLKKIAANVMLANVNAFKLCIDYEHFHPREIKSVKTEDEILNYIKIEKPLYWGTITQVVFDNNIIKKVYCEFEDDGANVTIKLPKDLDFNLEFDLYYFLDYNKKEEKVNDDQPIG